MKRRILEEFKAMREAFRVDVGVRRAEYEKRRKEFKKAKKANDSAAATGGDPVVVPPKPVYERTDFGAWWRTNKDKLPLMAQVARWACAISVSAAEVERLFSRANLVLTSRRNRISADKEERFVLAAYNITREWKERKKAGAAALEEDVMLRRFYNYEGLDIGEE